MLIISIGMLLYGSVLAQTPPPRTEWQPLKIQQTVEPVFPQSLLRGGVTEGIAHLAINTDPTGKLVEWLVVSYTRQEFADSAVAALKQWKFEPAHLRGEPVGTTIELFFHFEAKGVVVSTTILSESLEWRFQRMRGNAYTYKPCSARELDRIPMPTVIVRPQYSKELADQGVRGQVTVEYYIDETGSVRMPSVSADDNPILGTLSVVAVSQWKFTPPTSRGKNVLVKASQVFDFKGDVN
jgi:TonB family protein